MTKNKFDQIIMRTGTQTIKWEKTEALFGVKDLLPMWIADMDFQAPQAIQQAFSERIAHGIYGYTFVPDDTYTTISEWVERRYDWKITDDALSFSDSVVPAISTAIQAFTNKGDKVMLQSPVYAPFYEMIEINERVIVNCPLELTNNRYTIDFAAFEACLQEGVKMFLLCNPHNPGGRVWTKEELLKIGELCAAYDCLVFSDDIHADLVFPPHKYVPIASLKESFKDNIITSISPSKTFNVAGLHAAVVICENKNLQEQFMKTQRKQGFFSLGTFGAIGLEAAYAGGEAWLENVLAYLQENIEIAQRFIKENLPLIQVMEAEATYLLWLNCRQLDMTDSELTHALLHKGKLALEPGTKYGPGGEGFVRMNIACPREILLDGLERLKIALG